MLTRRAVAGDLHLPPGSSVSRTCFPVTDCDYLTAEGRIGDKEVLSQLRGQAERFISFVKLFATQDLR
jgi:hypothetical protein